MLILAWGLSWRQERVHKVVAQGRCDMRLLLDGAMGPWDHGTMGPGNDPLDESKS